MILIAAKQDDSHAIPVKQILEGKYNEKVFILDTSTFPKSFNLTGSFNNGDINFSLTDGQNIDIRLQDIKSFWWRRPQPVHIPENINDLQVRNFIFNECISALYGMLESCEGFWINDLKSDNIADYKPYQLKIAKQTGFHIPETLITNDSEKLAEFWKRHNKKIIFKAFNQRGVIWRPTRILREEDFSLIHNLKMSPVIFQTFINGTHDIRVTVIGETIFATEFDIRNLDWIDYRINMDSVPFHPHNLPNWLIEKIHLFMRTMGLEYGGIDFRLTPDGDYVFFEINTAGEFMYLQERTGQPIAESMALHLSNAKRVNIPQSA